MKKIYTVLIVMVLAMVTNGSYADIYVYMKATDENGVQINGESQTVGFVNWMELSSISDQSQNTAVIGGNGTGTSAGKATASPYIFQMPVNSSSLALLKKVYAGTRLNTVDIWFVKSGSVPNCNCAFYKIHMENVFVKNFQEALNSGDNLLTQQFSFLPVKFAWAYYKQTVSGTLPPGPTVKFGWDVSLNIEYNYAF